jgi:hypothetical protein
MIVIAKEKNWGKPNGNFLLNLRFLQPKMNMTYRPLPGKEGKKSIFFKVSDMAQTT